MALEVLRCNNEECLRSIGSVGGEEYCIVYRGIEVYGKLPVKWRCPECRRENERKPAVVCGEPRA